MDEKSSHKDSVAYRDACNRAQTHGAGPLSIEGYQQIVKFCGRSAEGWLFGYKIICNLDIPEHEQELFADARGCLVTDDGRIVDLSGPMFMDMLEALKQSQTIGN